MRRITTTMSAVCAALLLTGALATAQDFNTDKTTYVTFHAPVALPGITLPAGDYMFKLLDSQSNRNVVQIFDHDRTKLFATLIARPAQRDKVSGETVITFHEAPVNAAPALRYWYFPGDRFGQEFAYPKDQAKLIADANHMPVLAVDSTTVDATTASTASMSQVEPEAATVQAHTASAPQTMTPEPTNRINPPVADSAIGTSGTSPAPMAHSTAPAERTSGRSLPNTSGQTALLGVAGLLALASAFGVRAARRSAV